jgi:hypothetical protein
MADDQFTPTETQVMYRWDNYDSDRETYDLIFEQALHMIKHEHNTMGTLLMRLINDWEKNRRNVCVSVISAALDVATEYRDVVEMNSKLKAIFSHPGEVEFS